MSIKDHGGQFGGGLAKGAELDILNTDLNMFPLTDRSTGMNWNEQVHQFTHYADGSQGWRYAAGTYKWLAAYGTPSFSICPNSTTNNILYMYKLNSGKFIYFQNNYIYTFSPPSSTASFWYANTFSASEIHYVWEVGSYMYVFYDYNKLAIFNVSTGTPAIHAVRTISGLSSTPINIYVAEYGDFIYAKYSNPDGVLTQLKKDMLNDSVPAPVRTSSSIRGTTIDVSENYITLQNLGGSNLGIYRRSDFTLLREITMTATSTRPFIDEKNKVVIVGRSGEPSTLSVYLIETGVKLFDQTASTGSYYHSGSRSLDGKQIILVGSVRDTSGSRLPTFYIPRRSIKLTK